ncbi:hypothetical protein ACLOJK_000492 [Asimina triloba]
MDMQHMLEAITKMDLIVQEMRQEIQNSRKNLQKLRDIKPTSRQIMQSAANETAKALNIDFHDEGEKPIVAKDDNKVVSLLQYSVVLLPPLKNAKVVSVGSPQLIDAFLVFYKMTFEWFGFGKVLRLRSLKKADPLLLKGFKTGIKQGSLGVKKDIKKDDRSIRRTWDPGCFGTITLLRVIAALGKFILQLKKQSSNGYNALSAV